MTKTLLLSECARLHGVYRTTINFHKRVMRGEKPVPFVLIHTDMAWRAYAQKTLTKTFDEEQYVANGTYTGDGTITAGASIGAVDLQRRILSISSPSRTIRPSSRSISNSYAAKQQASISLTLDDADSYFSKLIALEPFLSKELRSYVGFEALPHWESLRIFQGIITSVMLKQTTIIIQADEQ